MDLCLTHCGSYVKRSRVSWPRDHRALVRQLLEEYQGDEDRLRSDLVRLALDVVARARQVDVGRRHVADDDDDAIPTVEEIVSAAAEQVGLDVRDVIPGRPASALLVAHSGPVVIGEDDATRVVVTAKGERAMIRSLTARGRSASAVFSVSPRELRMRDRFAPDGHSLLVFVLRAEGRAWIMTRGEVLAVYDSLVAGKKIERFSLAADGSLRVSMPKKPTGLDMVFPRVAKWEGRE